MRLTHWKKLSNPNYLGAYSIEDNKDLILTISKVQQETVTGPDGKKDECIVCYFSESEKPMILNSTNAKKIQKLLNTPYIEKWIGHKIQLGIEKVRAFGDIVEALRVRKFLPKNIEIKCERCGNNITASGNMSAEQVAEYAKKKFGKNLCVTCGKAAAAENGRQKTEAENAEADQ